MIRRLKSNVYPQKPAEGYELLDPVAGTRPMRVVVDTEILVDLSAGTETEESLLAALLFNCGLEVWRYREDGPSDDSDGADVGKVPWVIAAPAGDQHEGWYRVDWTEGARNCTGSIHPSSIQRARTSTDDTSYVKVVH